MVNLKLDKDVKEQLQEFSEEVGLSVTALLNVQIKQILRDRSFTVEAPLEPTEYLKEAIQATDEELKNDRKGMITLKSPADIDAFFDKLN